MTYTEQKKELKRRGISFRQIAQSLNIVHSTVSLILNDKYTGSEQTKQRVLEYVNNILIGREDLSPLVYSNIDIIIDSIIIAMRSPKMKRDQLDKLLYLYQKFSEIQKKINNGKS